MWGGWEGGLCVCVCWAGWGGGGGGVGGGDGGGVVASFLSLTMIRRQSPWYTSCLVLSCLVPITWLGCLLFFSSSFASFFVCSFFVFFFSTVEQGGRVRAGNYCGVGG